MEILIVDDSDINREVVASMLLDVADEECIDQAPNGKVALLMMAEKVYDIIFMDHMMPEMDGEEATRLIRAKKDSYYSRVPIIALTGNDNLGARQLLLDAGMNDLLFKPVDYTAIHDIIKKYLPDSIDSKSDSVEEKDAHPKDKSVDSLRHIVGIDPEIAIKNTGNISLLKSLFTSFVDHLDERVDIINDSVDCGDIKRYTTEVHALKSTCRIIGAVELGEAFANLEELGHNNDIEGIMASTSDVLDRFVMYKQYLAEYSTENIVAKRGLADASNDEICELIDVIVSAMNDFDIDTADVAMAKLLGLRFPAQIESEKNMLYNAVRDIQVDEVFRIAKKMKDSL